MNKEANKPTNNPDTNSTPMSTEELRGRLLGLHKQLEEVEIAAKEKGHGFIILALIALLLRGC